MALKGYNDLSFETLGQETLTHVVNKQTTEETVEPWLSILVSVCKCATTLSVTFNEYTVREGQRGRNDERLCERE